MNGHDTPAGNLESPHAAIGSDATGRIQRACTRRSFIDRWPFRGSRRHENSCEAHSYGGTLHGGTLPRAFRMISSKSLDAAAGPRGSAAGRWKKGRTMTPLRFRALLVALALIFADAWAATADAQLYQVLPPRALRSRQTQPQSSNDAAGGDTRITLEVFTGKEGVGYAAQEWEPVFERAGLLARIHPAFAGDKISIREKRLGKLREVFIVGKLERNGTLVVPGRKFARSESAAFEEWLRELKTYGAREAQRARRSGV